MKIISDDLNAISKVDLRNIVLERLVDDDLNFKAIFQEDNGATFKKWQKNKFEFNHLIKDNFPESKEQFDFTSIVETIKFNKKKEAAPKLEECLICLSKDELFKKSTDRDFTAIASIIFDTGWIKIKFNVWLGILSTWFHRKKPNYKQSHIAVKEAEELIKKFIYKDILKDLPKNRRISN